MKLNRQFLTNSVLALWIVAAPLRADHRGPAPSPEPEQSTDLTGLDLKQLADVKVTTASKFSETVSEAPGMISVVSRDEIRRFGAMTVREVLERVPGLTGTTAYFTDRSLIAARGDQTKIDGGHLLILINGRPTREILEGGIVSDLLESFPVSALERIEVIKGPGSVLYGSNAYSAVVNLITIKADSTGMAVSGLAGDGSWGGSAAGTLQSGNLGIVTAAQFHRRPTWTTSYGFLDPLSGAVSLQEAMMRDRGPGAYLGVQYKGLSLMSAYTQWDSTSFVRGVVGQPRWRRGFADLGYQFKASDYWDMSVNLTYTRTTFGLSEYPWIRRDANEAVVEWTNILRIGDRDQLTFGTLYNHVQGTERFFGISPAITISDGARSGGAAYAQLDHRLLDSLKLIGGLQVNKIENIAVDAVPRVGVIWNPTARVNVKALYSQAFRAPSINETSLDHPGLQGNPDLRPEKVATFDLGLTYQRKRISTGVSYFHSRQTDRIIEDTSTARWKYMNQGNATFQGIEWESKYYGSTSWLLLGSLLYQANHDGSGLKNVTPIPNFGTKAGISYRVERGWTASLFDIYERPIDPRYDGPMNPKPAAYHLVNAHLRYDLSQRLGLDARKTVALFAHVENLADQRVWMPGWGDNSADSIPVYRGRTIYFGMEIALNKE